MRKIETILQARPGTTAVLPVYRFTPVSTGSDRCILPGFLNWGFRALVASAWLLIATQFVANAQTNWNVTTGDWALGGNWTAGVPNSTTAAFITNNGTATISGTETDTALSLNLGGVGTNLGVTGGDGTLTMSGGTLTVSNTIAVGGGGGPGSTINGGNGGTGTLTLSGGTLTASSMTLGGNGGAGGAPNVLGGTGGAGTLTLSGGTLTASSMTLGGNGGNGSAPNALGGNGGTGTLTLSGGTLIASSMTLGGNGGVGGFGTNANAPGGTGGNGTLTLNGGNLTLSNGLFAGGKGNVGITPVGGNGGNGGGGTVMITIGTLTVSSGGVFLGGNGVVGSSSDASPSSNSGTGALTLSGGNLTLTSGSLTLGGNGGNGGSDIENDGGNGGNGTFTLNGGNLTLSNGNMTLGGNGGNGTSRLLNNGGNAGAGTFTLSGGTLTLSNGNITLGGNGGNGGNGGTGGSGNQTAGGNGGNGGNGTLTLSGGTLTLSVGSITLGGINGKSGTAGSGGNGGTGGAGGHGTLNLDSGTLTAGNITVGTLGVLNFGPASGQTVVVNANISGLGSQTVTFSTQGKVDLNGTTDFGSVTIGVGATLQLGNGIRNGTAGSGTITDNGALVFDFNGSQTVANAISGGGSVTQLGGTAILTATNTYSGSTTLNGGTLQAGSSSAFSSNSAFVVNVGTTLDLHGFSNSIGSLSGSGSVTNDGSTLATLTVGNDNTSTTFSGTLTNGSSTLGLTKIGTGTLTLTGAGTYTGGTMISGGVLQLGNGGTSGSIVGNLTSQGTFVIDRSDTYTFAGNISGAGSFEQNGSGTTVLSGSNTYSGATSVNNGILRVTGSLGLNSVVTVASGATLAGSGTINGPVTILNGGILAPGDPATLTAGSLTLNLGSTLNYQLGLPNVVGGGINDLVQVNGNLTLAGTLNITNVGGFGEGVYRLFNYTGSLTNNGLAFGTLPTGLTASELLVQTSQANQINLLVSASGFADQFWDGATTTADGIIHGGSGTWDSVTTNWTNMDAMVNAPWQNGFAIFEGTAGTVTLGANINFIGMQFMTDGYTITAPGSQTLIAAPGSIIRVDSGVTATIAAPIVDGSTPGSLTKTDLGTLILTGTNTYTGGTTISAGTLQLGNGGTSGSILGNVINNGVFAINRSDTYTFAGNVSGTGAFQQLGTGTTILTGTNTYTGGTTINAGTLQAGSSTALSPNSAFTVISLLDLHGFSNTIGSLAGTGAVTNDGASPATLTADGNNTNTTFSGTLIDGTSSLAFTKTGTGTLILTGTNTYTDGTTINAGTLQIGNGGTTGSIVGDVTDNAALVFNRSDSITFGGVINGTGALVQMGSGTLTLTADNSYGGGTTINPGATLQLGNGGTTGSIVGNMTDNGSLIFNRSDNVTFNAIISGSGNLAQNGSGTTILGGTNTYSGGTIVNNGRLLVNNSQALGLGNVVVNGGVLGADPQPINVKGNYTQSAGGTLQLQVAGANPGQYDTLNVGGNAALGGTLQLISLGFQPKAGNQLTLVTTGGVVSSRFAQFIDPFATGPGFTTVDLVYGRDFVLLEFLNLVPPVPPVIVTIDFASFALTPDERAAANLLDAVQLDPRAAHLISFLDKEPFANLPADFDKISPESLTAFYEISFSGANIQRLSLENRLEGIRNGSGGESVIGAIVYLDDKADGKSSKNPPMLPPVREKRWDFWSTSFGDFVHVDSDFNARGYKFTTGGIDLGIDYRLTNHLAFGLMGNYAHTWSDLRPGSIDVDSARGGLYATYFNSCFYINAGIYGGYNSYDSSRRGLQGNANGNSDGAEFSTFVSGGYDFHFGHLTIGPIASLQYTNVYVDSFSEKGSLAPLSIHSDSEESLRSDVGFRAFFQWRVGSVVVEPFLKATWEHEFKYSALPITAGFANISGPSATFLGPSEGHDSAVVDAGISVSWTPRISTYVSYNGLLGRDRYDSNGGSGGVRISF